MKWFADALFGERFPWNDFDLVPCFWLAGCIQPDHDWIESREFRTVLESKAEHPFELNELLRIKLFDKYHRLFGRLTNTASRSANGRLPYSATKIVKLGEIPQDHRRWIIFWLPSLDCLPHRRPYYGMTWELFATDFAEQIEAAARAEKRLLMNEKYFNLKSIFSTQFKLEHCFEFRAFNSAAGWRARPKSKFITNFENVHFWSAWSELTG